MTTIEQLQQAIEALQAEIEADKKRLIEPKERRVSELKEQLSDMQVEAYFQAHPEQRLTKGDELLPTERYRAIIRKRGFIYEYFMRNIRVHDVNFPLDWVPVHVVTDGGGSGFPLDVVVEMRQAWLQEHGQ